MRGFCAFTTARLVAGREVLVAEMYDARFRIGAHREARVGAHAGRQPRFAPADDRGPDLQLALVDQPGLESLRRGAGLGYAITSTHRMAFPSG
jgi:hypothetical protein